MATTKKKWSEQETVRFVELYEAEEVLWNVKLNDYKNKDARNAAIQRLIHNLNMGCTIQDVNNQINNIRSTYMQEKAKIKISTGTGSGADDVYVPSLVWFEIADRFLSGVIKSRKTFQNVETSSDSCPSPDIPATYSPDIPATYSPDIPATYSPDIPATYSPDIPATYSPDIPATYSPDIPTDPSPAITSLSAGNTGNLTRHLKRKHPTISVSPIIREPVAMTSETLQLPNATVETSQDNQSILVSSPLPSSSSGQNLMTDYIQNTKPLPHQKSKELDEQLIKLIAKEYHPFRIVERAEFKKFIYLLNPRYSPPTRKTLANVLLTRLYAKVQNEVEQLVAATLAMSHYRRVDIDNQRKFYCNNCSYTVTNRMTSRLDTIKKISGGIRIDPLDEDAC